ncbi:MAG: hypothetical protein ACJAZB_001254 [Psychrosphaera sp.]
MLSKFDAYYQLEDYKKEALSIGKKVFLSGKEANYLSFPDENVFLVFLPYDSPKYVFSYPNEKMVIDTTEPIF